MNVDNLLLWSMGLEACKEGSELNDNDFYKLLRLLKKHKLLIRFYHKITYIKWLNNSQLALLKQAYDKQMEFINGKIEALEELSQKSKEMKVDYVIIKGLSTYFLLCDIENIRASADIDILCSNYRDFVRLLEGLGYERVDKVYPAHEYISMRRGDVVFDIHKYIPILRYHSRLKENIEKIDISRTWLISERANQFEKDITYSDLEIQFSKSIVITNLTMHAFITCINTFRNYYDAVDQKATIGITLFDFLELKELLTHAQFNMSKFIEMTNDYMAWDAVRFIDIFLQHFFGITLFNINDSIKSFPYKVTWTGVWAIPNSINSLISRSFDDLNQSFSPKIKCDKGRLLGKELEGFNSHIVNFLKVVEVTRSDLHYSISVTIPCLTRWVTDCFTLKLSKDSFYGWECREDNFDPVYLADGIIISYLKETNEYTIHLSIPYQQVLNNSLTLCIDRWGGTGVLVTYIPIVI